MNIAITILVFFFGAIIGSFLNVVILRLPEGEKLSGRSHCPNCRHQLGSLELIPLFSFLFLGGKCLSCKRPISPRYFVVEAVTGLLFAAAWHQVSPATPMALFVLFSDFFVLSVLVIVFAVDFEHFIILDSVTFLSLAVVTILNAGLDVMGHNPVLTFHSHLAIGLVGAVLGALPFFLLWFFSKGRWMGFGDVKLGLLLGAVFGWQLFAVCFMLAIFLGTMVSIFLLLGKSKTLKSRVPFGTFLSVAAVITLFYGPQLLRWYLSYVGF